MDTVRVDRGDDAGRHGVSVTIPAPAPSPAAIFFKDGYPLDAEHVFVAERMLHCRTEDGWTSWNLDLVERVEWVGECNALVWGR